MLSLDISQSLISCLVHLFKFISKVFNKLVWSFIFHVSGAGISDSVMPTWKKKKNLLAWTLNNFCLNLCQKHFNKIIFFSFYVMLMFYVMLPLFYLYICLQKQNMLINLEEKEVDEIEAICDLIFECLKFLLSSLDLYFIIP